MSYRLSKFSLIKEIREINTKRLIDILRIIFISCLKILIPTKFIFIGNIETLEGIIGRDNPSRLSPSREYCGKVSCMISIISIELRCRETNFCCKLNNEVIIQHRFSLTIISINSCRTHMDIHSIHSNKELITSINSTHFIEKWNLRMGIEMS